MKRIYIALAAITVCGLAQAQGPQPSSSSAAPSASAVDHAATFKMVDKNDDKKISKAEASADGLANAAFNKLDANADGSLDLHEYSGRLLAR